jgi:YD repeat-containing protein
MQLFISYAHGDRDWLEGDSKKNLLPGWESALRDADVTIWWDRDRVGTPLVGDWEERVLAELDRSSIAILLISTKFVDSRYIRDKELPRILERAARHEMEVLPVWIKPAPLDGLALDRYQFAPDRNGPLSQWEKSEHDFDQAVLTVRRLLLAIVHHARHRALGGGPRARAREAPGASADTENMRVPVRTPETVRIRAPMPPLVVGDLPSDLPTGGRASAKVAGALLLALAASIAAGSWFGGAGLAEGSAEPGPLSHALATHLLNSPTRPTERVTLVTDAVLRSPTGQPVLELTRVFSPRASGGTFGRHWFPLLPYSVTGWDLTPVGSLSLFHKMTVDHLLTGERSELTLNTEDGYDWRGPGLEPWKRLVLQNTLGVRLEDDRGNAIQFESDMRLVALTIGGARWVFHYFEDKLALVNSLPSAIKLSAIGGKQMAKLEDAMDATSFEQKGTTEEGIEFAPPSLDRWKSLSIATDGNSAMLTDRWNARYSFKPLSKCTGLYENRVLAGPPDGTITGLRLVYDSDNRVRRVDVGRQGQVFYEYDNEGRLVAMTDASDARHEYEYTAEDEPPRVLLPAKRRTARLLGAGVAALAALSGLFLLLRPHRHA